LRYGLIWQQQPRQNDGVVCLTIAGMARLRAFGGHVDYFLDVLRYVVRRRLTATFEPHNLVEIKVTADDIRAEFGVANPYEAITYDLLEREPAIGFGSRGRPTEGPWFRDLSRELRHFADVAGVNDYLDRVATYIAPPQPRSHPIVDSSPLDLATALDYFDTVWRHRFGRAIVHVPSSERLTKIAFDVASADEFDSRLSALADVLKNLAVPGVTGVSGGHPLARLAPFLQRELKDAASARIADAVAVLTAVTQIRNVRQHGAAAATAVGALRQLGVTFPVTDWAETWRVVRARATEALNALREEVQTALLQSDEAP
jgi:hypothetical protein